MPAEWLQIHLKHCVSDGYKYQQEIITWQWQWHSVSWYAMKQQPLVSYYFHPHQDHTPAVIKKHQAHRSIKKSINQLVDISMSMTRLFSKCFLRVCTTEKPGVKAIDKTFPGECNHTKCSDED